MAERKRRLKPSKKATGHPKQWAKKARQYSDKLAASGRTFSDSTETIRTDRDSRV